MLSATFIAGCKDRDDPDATGTVQLRIVPTFNGNDFSLGQTYAGRDGRAYRLTFLRYYLSNLFLTKADNTTELLADVALIDEGSTDTRTVSAQIKVGEYTGISYGLGLDADRNGMDPATFEAEHPQADVSMYWTWATKYIFLKYEGETDASGTGGSSNQTYFFHVGGDQYYTPVSETQTITVVEDETVTINIALDYDRFLNGINDYIDVSVDNATHTMDNMPLANRVIANWADMANE